MLEPTRVGRYVFGRHGAGYDGGNQRVGERELHGRGRQGDRMPLAHCLDAPRFFQYLF